MKPFTKAAIGLSAAGAAYVLVQKGRHARSGAAVTGAEIYGFVNSGYEAVREAFAENFARRREIGAACCVYHKGEKVVDLWAGIIGYRCLRLAGLNGNDWRGARLGLYGFGAAGHICIQLARSRGADEPCTKSRCAEISLCNLGVLCVSVVCYCSEFINHRDTEDAEVTQRRARSRLFVQSRAEVHVCTRNRERHQALAHELCATWVGDAAEDPPVKLDAAIIFAPAGELVPTALKALTKGGTLVLGGIHMTPIPSFDYSLIYGERTVTSVANNTRDDGREFP